MKTHHLDADYCVLTGDLTQDGGAISYKLIEKEMATLPFRYLSILGNYDRRDVMREHVTFTQKYRF